MAYLRGMLAQRLIRFLTVLAIFLSPVGMTAGASAQVAGHHSVSVEATAAPMSASHCAEMDKQSKEQSAPSIDCMIACAAMIPALGGQFDAPILAPASVARLKLKAFLHGLGPEAATPPPRFS